MSNRTIPLKRIVKMGSKRGGKRSRNIITPSGIISDSTSEALNDSRESRRDRGGLSESSRRKEALFNAQRQRMQRERDEQRGRINDALSEPSGSLVSRRNDPILGGARRGIEITDEEVEADEARLQARIDQAVIDAREIERRRPRRPVAPPRVDSLTESQELVDLNEAMGGSPLPVGRPIAPRRSSSLGPIPPLRGASLELPRRYPEAPKRTTSLQDAFGIIRPLFDVGVNALSQSLSSRSSDASNRFTVNRDLTDSEHGSSKVSTLSNITNVMSSKGGYSTIANQAPLNIPNVKVLKTPNETPFKVVPNPLIGLLKQRPPEANKFRTLMFPSAIPPLHNGAILASSLDPSGQDPPLQASRDYKQVNYNLRAN